MANNIDLTISAPNQLFELLRCSAWLILRRSPTGASAPKRSCFRFASLTLRTAHRSPVSLCFSPKRTTFRFASLTLRLRTETFFQKVPVFRMAYSAIPHHRPYGRWCFARLIRQAETLELQPHSRPPSKRTALSPLKRSCSRFASLTLRTPHRPPVSLYFSGRFFSVCAPKPSFRRFRCSAWLILRFRTIAHTGAGVSLGLFGKPKRSSFSRFATSIKAHCAVSSETLMLQPLRGLRTPHRPIVSSPLAAAAD